MGDESGRERVLGPNPALEHLQVPASDSCWWCGDKATTEEHRFKASTLRRVAAMGDGSVKPNAVFKKSADYEGTLNSLKKGAQIRWRKNLCASCNSSKSQPFDRAYDDFEDFLVKHIDVISEWEMIDWKVVYGSAWRERTRNLARYLGKQLGCMLATYQLQIPADLIGFLNGADRCPSTGFTIWVDPHMADAHAQMRSDGRKDGLSGLVGLIDSMAYQSEGVFTGIDYGYHIGYVLLLAQWRAEADVASWFEFQLLNLPRLCPE